MPKGQIQLVNNKGFTLIEMMIVVLISSLAVAGIYSFYTSFQENTTTQKQITDVQQNLRASIYLLTTEMRRAGFDPTGSGNFGITDISFRDINNNPDISANGFSTFSYTADLNEDGVVDSIETFTYSLYDFPVGAVPPDGNTDLSRTVGGGGRQLLSENVESFGLAYAYDISTDTDYSLETSGGQVIWAIDSDNDGTLDRNLDANTDGRIDENDQPGAGNRLITGAAIAPPVAMADIRAVRIWILIRSSRQDPNYFDNNTYTVGRNIFIPDNTNDGFRRRLLVANIKFRNLGLL